MTISEEQAKSYESTLINDPVRWIEETFGQPLMPWQKEIVESVRDNRETHVPSCVNSGKTNIFGKIVLWWLARYAGNSKVITTATVWDQIEYQLWREVADAHARSVTPLGGKLLSTRYDLSPQWFAVGLSPEKSVNLQGYHSVNILVIVDEADGVDMMRWSALDGLMTTANAKWLCGGNPIDPTSEWKKRVDLARKKRSALVRHITAEEVLAVSDSGQYPFLLQRHWVEGMIARWGTSHPYVQAKILAQWPDQSTDVLVPLAWLERAKGREVKRGERVLFVDVAREGLNKTVRTLLAGGWVMWQRATAKEDTMQTAGRVFADANEYGVGLLGVDDTGVGGGVTDRLRQLGKTVNAFNFGASALDKEHFVNAGSEAYWRLREAFERAEIGISMEDAAAAEQLIAELNRPVWDTDEKARIKVNKYGLRHKTEATMTVEEKTLLSPDYGDSLAGAWAMGRLFRQESTAPVATELDLLLAKEIQDADPSNWAGKEYD